MDPVEIGGLRVLGRLGAGGMGRVWLALEPRTGARRAVKVLAPGADPEARVRFQREAEAMAAVDDHPAVLRIHGAGVDPAAGPYLVMAHAPGGSLADRLRTGPLPPAEVLDLGRRLARGLAHVHGRGVLHRDLKPENVLFDETGAPKLVDFGLAQVRDGGRLTRTGTLLGTPAYMAPEQARGEPADARTDVHGLGALLYAALTGRPPFDGPTPFHVLAAVAERALPRPGVAPALEAVLLKALAKAPAARYPTAAALADALDALGAPPARRRSAAALAAVALAAVALAAVALAAVAAALRPAPGRPARPGPAHGTAASAGSTTGPTPPAWWASTPPEERPAWPLPEGLVARPERGRYEHLADGSVLVWCWSPPGGQGFFVGLHEVTAGQWRRAMRGAGLSSLDPRAPDDHPVTGVRLAEARAYCRRAGLRLPTNAEWVWAARGPTTRRFPWGNEEPQAGQALWGAFDGAEPVGRRPAGASFFGCLGMAGNAAEWIDDGPPSTKGGSWQATDRRALEVLERNRFRNAEAELADTGLRVVRDGPAVAPPPWWSQLAPERRPPWPLPAGIVPTPAAGEYRGAAEASVLVWVPPADGAPGFFIGKHEVTRGQWRRLGLPLPPGATDDEVAVTGVTWREAIEYCRTAGVRLPTDAEWTRAARGPTPRRYPWGDEPPSPERSHVGTAPDRPGRPAGASWAGCLDMAGNAGEWLQEADVEGAHLIRGGSHASALPQDLLIDARFRRDERPERTHDVGLRVVQDP